MAISFDDIKKLKSMTGVGVTDAKKALEDADGDFDKAVEEMRKKGLAKAEKKGERTASEGLIDSYVHSSRIGVLVEVNCETDFVAKTDDFKNFVHDIAMHVAATDPEYISPEDVPEEVVEKEKSIEAEALKKEGKPANIVDKILEGKIEKYYEQVCLNKQAFIKNPDVTIEQYTKELIAKLGENIVISQISRIELGGSSN